MNVTQAAAIFTRIRQKRPLVHQITNAVVMNTSANITLCVGALPVMANALEEVEEMVSAASALVLNIGTLWAEQVKAMRLAARRANQLCIPVILDPVGAGATKFRTESALTLLGETKIDVVRGNLAEVATLSGIKAEISGVESINVGGDAASIAGACARKFNCVVAVTGAIDVVTDGRRLLRIANGHPMMANVTGTGCMSTVVVGACTAVEKDYVFAASAALSGYGLAGELAAAKAHGPGSFQVEFFDAVANLKEEQLRQGMRIEEVNL